MRLVGISLFLFTFLLIAGCGRPGGEIAANLGQKTDLKLGKTAAITGEQLKVRFADMLGDSRCPSNAVCIWAGEVSCKIEITYAGKAYVKTLVKSGASAEYATTDFSDYEIQFDVQPYPEAGKQIKKDDYFLRLIINKKP